MSPKPHNKLTFTLCDLGLKKPGAVQIFDSHSLDSDGNLLPFNAQMAVVTHYLHNRGTDFESVYQPIAQSLMHSWTECNTLAAYAESNIVSDYNALQEYMFGDLLDVPFPKPENPSFTFIDLFAGIGGFRLAMQNLGGACVFSSEWDAHAQRTYLANYGEVPFGDITSEQTKSFIPDGFDVLCAGFPCQAFSVAGYRRGFEDTRGTLFFDVAEIIRRKRPKAVILENVKNLYTHDEGRTFAVIKGTLEELGYHVYYKVLNAKEYANVPQNRERIFIVCFDPVQVPNYNDFEYPRPEPLTRTIHDCIDSTVTAKEYFYTDSMNHFDIIKSNITSRDTVYQWRRQYVRENKSNVCPTLTANMGGGGHNVPLILTEYGIRKLTPKECLNFQGYPEAYIFPNTIPNSAKYKQAGNSVVVPLVQKVCQNMIALL